MSIIVPGVLTNDKEDYAKRLEKAVAAAALVQIDVIDGRFAPNTTVGVSTIKKYPTKSALEVQLMVVDPSFYIAQLVETNFVSRIIFPLETAEDVSKNIQMVKDAEKEVGLSINPETKVSEISSFADQLDVLCIFSASPGFAGKKLEEAVYDRIIESKKLYPSLPVEIDIGVNEETAPKLVAAGADFLIATSALHNAPDYKEAYLKLAKLAAGSR